MSTASRGLATAPHTLHDGWCERANLLAPGHRALSHRSRRIALEMSALEGALQNPTEQRGRIANGHRPASGGETVALPARDHVRRDLDEGERAELRKDMSVVEVAVPSARTFGETCTVGLGPGFRYVFRQCDASAVDRGERSDLLAPAHVGSEVGRVALSVERASSVSTALAPADLPPNGAVAECSLLDLHCALGVSECCSQGMLWQGRLSTTRPTAWTGVRNLNRAGEPPVDRVPTHRAATGRSGRPRAAGRIGSRAARSRC